MYENFYFKYLDLEYNSIEVESLYKIYKDTPGRFNLIKTNEVMQYLPSIDILFKNLNLVPSKVAYINIGPNTTQVIHCDWGVENLALNFPVYNCSEVFTEFYDIPDSELREGKTMGTALPFYYYENLNNKKFVNKFILNKPALLNIKKAHSVVNTSRFSRISLSFRFKSDPWFLVN
jgi:hypothetical protein